MKTVLIVEDNDTDMKFVRDLLQHKGYKTLEAVTGAEGVRLAREARPDLVLMDIHLPDLDGISALARLRAAPETRHMRVIAVSATAMSDREDEIVSSGFDEYIPKPINIRRFIETLERVIGKA